MTNRRIFMAKAAALAGWLALPAGQAIAANRATRQSAPLRILMLGATGYIGPHFIRAGLDRGHRVSIFRWKGSQEHAEVPEGAEQLMGDRNGDLESIKNRDWDAVIDLATYVPNWVRSLGQAIKGRVKHYTFVSSVVVYDKSTARNEIVETDPVLTYTGKEDPYSLTSPGSHAHALKVLCEREAEKQFPGKTLVLRPGHIVGPGDWISFFPFWIARMAKGGEMLVAGNPSAPVQFIDVRDVAEWGIYSIEQGITGTYNTVGPTTPITLGQLVNTTREVMQAPTQLTWVPTSWLEAQAHKELWANLLFWAGEPTGVGGMRTMNIERAIAKGLTTRPLRVTLQDTIEWYKQLTNEGQAELPPVWIKKLSRTLSESGTWPVYLEREKELLNSWRSSEEL